MSNYEEIKKLASRLKTAIASSSELLELFSEVCEENVLTAENAKKKFEEANLALLSFRFFRYFKLRREGKSLITQAAIGLQQCEQYLLSSEASFSGALEAQHRLKKKLNDLQ